MFNKLYSSLTFLSQALQMINGDREIQCHQHKTMIYGDKENSIISIKITKLFEELKLTEKEQIHNFLQIQFTSVAFTYVPGLSS